MPCVAGIGLRASVLTGAAIRIPKRNRRITTLATLDATCGLDIDIVLSPQGHNATETCYSGMWPETPNGADKFQNTEHVNSVPGKLPFVRALIKAHD